MMEPVHCVGTTTNESGAGAETIWYCMATGLASWRASVELAPARNLHAGQESLEGAVLPVVSGQSSV